jgi:hypothetical protein
MIVEYLSLSQLLQGTRIYERLPQPLQEALKRSVWYTLVTQLIVLTLFILLPRHIWWARIQPGGFFILEPTVHITNSVLDVAVQLLPYLIVVSLFNLFLTLTILTVSLLLTQPVHEPFHWLAALNAVPAGLNAGVISIITIFAVIIIIINLIAWVIIISIVIGIIAALFNSDSSR